MHWFLDRLFGFFNDNVPSWRALLLGGPPGLAWSLAALWFAGWLKQRRVRTGYTRKIVVIGAAATLAEAVSPHGWDNATLQLVPTALVWLWLT